MMKVTDKNLIKKLMESVSGQLREVLHCPVCSGRLERLSPDQKFYIKPDILRQSKLQLFRVIIFYGCFGVHPDYPVKKQGNVPYKFGHEIFIPFKSVGYIDNSKTECKS